ncbi:9288_t:CDS:1, partial [Gigaspora rosea]
MIVADPFVTKHCRRPLIKRLKSSSESYCHNELTPHANLQSSSLGIPFANIDLNSHVVDNNAEELCHG